MHTEHPFVEALLPPPACPARTDAHPLCQRGLQLRHAELVGLLKGAVAGPGLLNRIVRQVDCPAPATRLS